MREEDISYFNNREFKRILRSYEDALQQNRPIYMDADDLTDIAEYYMVNSQEEKANEAIGLAVSLHPDSVDPQVFLSRQEMFHDNMERAHEICNAIPDQDDREVKFLRAELLIREQRNAEALEILKTACESEKEEQDHFMYDTIGIFMDYMLYDYADSWCRKLKKTNPQYKGLPELEAEIKMCLGDYETAIRLLNEILDIDSYNIQAWNMLAESHFSKGSFEEAIDACQFALAINEEDFRATATLADCYYHTANYTKAHRFFQKALQSRQDDVLYHMDAVCLYQMGEYEKAMEQLENAGNIIGDDQEKQIYIAMQQATVASKLHRLDDALSYLKTVKSLIREKRALLDYEVLYGQVMLENGFPEKAKAHFETAFSKCEDSEKTALVIGIAYYEHEYYQDAANILSRLAEIPDSITANFAHPYLALCYRHLEDRELYLKYLLLATKNCTDLTAQLFEEYFPGVKAEDLYFYAFKDAYGYFPKE